MRQDEFRKRYQYDPSKDRVGKGGFGNVFKAYDNYNSQWVAIKIAEAQPGMEAVRLKKEVEMASALPPHPNIARYEACHTYQTDIGECDYAVLQYYEEGNLLQLLEKQALGHDKICQILRQVLEGIDFLHSNKVLHRDLKPQNILMAKHPGGDFVPKITDFGISKRVEQDKSAFTNTLQGGTLSYASAEQLKASTIRWNADLWSFGVIAYQAFTGELPFTAGGHDSASEAGRQELFRQITGGKLPDGINRVPEPWRGLIRRCLAVDAEQRIKSAKECLSILSEGRDAAAPDIETRIDAPAPPKQIGLPEQPETAKPNAPRKKTWTAAAAALAAIIPLALWFALKKDVYVAGFEKNAQGNNVATLWKNGQVHSRLTDGKTNAEAVSVCVSGSGAYVAGHERFGNKYVATLWKNGQVHSRLTDGKTNAEAMSVYVSGSDAYVAGWEANSRGELAAKIWKNGTALPDMTREDYIHARGNSDFDSNNDAYLATFEKNPQGRYVAVVTKNGEVLHRLSDGNNDAMAYSVFVK
jgi:serine/threonine protein kinase